VQNFAFKFQAVDEKTAKKILGGYFILPHLVVGLSPSTVTNNSMGTPYEGWKYIVIVWSNTIK